MKKGLQVSIKMFQVGELGDCFLLHFSEGSEHSHVLIDCGSFRNQQKSKNRLREIATYIQSEVKGKKLDVVVGTHQHNDHVSGFVHGEDLFNDHIQQVWLSWLDNPKDRAAQKIKKQHKQLVEQVGTIHREIKRLGVVKDTTVLEDVLGFYGATGNGAPEVPAEGIARLKKIGEEPVDYLTPGDERDLPGLSKGKVKVYVLGPPCDTDMLYDINPNADESYDKNLSEPYDKNLAVASTNARSFLSALSNRDPSRVNRSENAFPFDRSFKRTKETVEHSIREKYQSPEKAWQKIDQDWLEQADRLALYLDTYTNNSSLVLAFELVKAHKFLLFAADAQTGNWLSWDTISWEKNKQFSIKMLLENTVLYKVGHHASHNATLKKDLESMNHEELVALIPVDDKDPNITKINGWKMPAKNLYKRLKEKTGYRVLRMDHGFADDCQLAGPKATWNKLPFTPKIDAAHHFIEYTIQG